MALARAASHWLRKPSTSSSDRYFGLGDPDQIGAEEEFLYSLNRFNVIASRARAKLIVLMSRRLVDHLPRERDTLVQSRLLKHYADGFLRRSVSISLPGFEGECEVKFR